MSNRAHLTPALTIDKRGRATTVYRNLAAGSAANSAPSVPPSPTRPEVMQATETGGPFRAPSERSHDELAGFMRSADKWWSFGEGFTVRTLSSPSGVSAAALAMDFVESGEIDHRDALWIVLTTPPESDPSLAADTLRIAAHLGSRLQLSAFGTDRLLRAARGCRGTRTGWTGRPLTTAERLDSCAAVVEFILRVGADTKNRVVEHMKPPGGGEKDYDYVRSAALDAILRERPQDLQAIIELAEGHGPDGPSDEAVASLRGRLNGVTAPLANGYL